MHNLLSQFFQHNTLNGTAKAPTVDWGYSKRYQKRFLSTNRQVQQAPLSHGAQQVNGNNFLNADHFWYYSWIVCQCFLAGSVVCSPKHTAVLLVVRVSPRGMGTNAMLSFPGLSRQCFKMATNFKEAVRKVPRPSKLWNPFGFSVMPRRFPRQRRGSKRQPIVPLKEWKIIRGDTVSNRRPSFVMDESIIS